MYIQVLQYICTARPYWVHVDREMHTRLHCKRSTAPSIYLLTCLINVWYDFYRFDGRLGRTENTSGVSFPSCWHTNLYRAISATFHTSRAFTSLSETSKVREKSYVREWHSILYTSTPNDGGYLCYLYRLSYKPIASRTCLCPLVHVQLDI